MKTEEIKKQDELKEEQLDNVAGGRADHRDGSADPFSSTHYPVGATVIYTTKMSRKYWEI